MKVLFVNPPVVRSKDSHPQNDFRLDGATFPAILHKIRGGKRLWNASKLGGSVRYGVRAGSRWPWTLETPTEYSPNYPFFMGYAAGLVESEGHAVELLDCVAEGEFSYDNFLRRVEAAAPDLIIQECSTPTIDIDLWLTRKLSKIADLAVAGPHFSTPEIINEMQTEHPHIKYILQGEYIYGAQELVRTLRPGVYPARVVTDLELIPFPFRKYAAAAKYFDPSMPTEKPQLQIYGSKGCPFKCSFCVWPQAMFQKKVTLRKPESIAREIREAIAQHSYKSIFFDDDTFNMGPDRISRLCDELKKIGLPWTMMGRIDISPDSLYDKMIDSGCVGMRFGIETFDHGVLARVKKGIERVDFRAALERIAVKYPHVMMHITMMRDMPGQTEEMHQEDMRIIHNIGFAEHNVQRSYQLAHCAPFPGTALYDEMLAEKGRTVMDDYRKYDGGQKTLMAAEADHV